MNSFNNPNANEDPKRERGQPGGPYICRVCGSNCGTPCPNLTVPAAIVSEAVKTGCKKVRNRYGRKIREAMEIIREAIQKHSNNRTALVNLGDKGTLFLVAHDEVRDVLARELAKLEEPLSRFECEGTEPDSDEERQG